METENKKNQKELSKEEGELISKDGEIKKEKKSVWQWIVGGLVLFLALIFLFSNFLASLVLLLVGALIFPPSVNFIKKKTKIKLTKKNRIVSVVVGVFLAFLLIGASGEKEEIKIYQSEEDPKDVIESSQIVLETVSALQDAQLNTVALLAVRFETADQEEYLAYIDEVIEKWEKVEEGAEKMKAIEDDLPVIPSKPISQSQIVKTVSAKNDSSSREEFSEIEFGDGFEGKNGEVEVGVKEGVVYKDAIEDAFAFKRTGLSKTANQYLRKHLKTTAEGAQEALEEHRETMNLTVKDVDAAYGSAERAAQKIAYTSKVSLYVLGTVASFGSAAAATSGAGVISGYVVGAWGAAIGAVDVALDIAEEASTISTGKGLVSYRKDKATIGKMSEIHAYANISQILISSGGSIKFGENAFSDANNFVGVWNLSPVGRNMSFELKKDEFDVEIGDKVKIPRGETLDSIIKKIYKSDFDYNPISVTVDDEGNLSFDSSGYEETVADNFAGDCQNGEGGDIDSKNLERYWPECPSRKDTCQGIENTCIYKGRCVCKKGFYATALDSEGPILDCVTEEDWFRRLGIQLRGINSSFEGEGSGLLEGDQEFLDNIEKNHPKQLERAQKAKNCDL